MTYLAKLKLDKEQKVNNASPFERAKAKLLANLDKQLQAAEAMVKGEKYLVERYAFVKADDGSKVKTLVKRPVRKWYWRDATGLVRFAVRVRNKRVELTAGKTDIVVGDDKELPAAIGVVIEAVKAGELDKQITALVGEK